MMDISEMLPYLITFIIGVTLGLIGYFYRGHLDTSNDGFITKALRWAMTAVEKYETEIKEYDEKNGTHYYEDLKGLIKEIEDLMKSDSFIEYIQKGYTLGERILSILTATGVIKNL
jgi:hypothetical protein